MQAVTLAESPELFQQESLKLIDSFLNLKSSAFYLVDSNMRHHSLVTHNLAMEADDLYQSRYMRSDPLNPGLHENSNASVLNLDSMLSAHEIQRLPFYRDFLKPMNFRYVTDMFLRANGRIIAVITMLRAENQGRFATKERRILQKLQPFLEYSFKNVYLPWPIVGRENFRSRYKLTERELDILELVSSGASNKTIAKQLALGVPTIKTHLQHIYRKTGVATRAELLAKVFTQQKSPPGTARPPMSIHGGGE